MSSKKDNTRWADEEVVSPDKTSGTLVLDSSDEEPPSSSRPIRSRGRPPSRRSRGKIAGRSGNSAPPSRTSQLKTMDHNALVQMVGKMDEEIKQLRADLNSMATKNTRLEEKMNEMHKVITNLEQIGLGSRPTPPKSILRNTPVYDPY